MKYKKIKKEIQTGKYHINTSSTKTLMAPTSIETYRDIGMMVEYNVINVNMVKIATCKIRRGGCYMAQWSNKCNWIFRIFLRMRKSIPQICF